MWDMQNIHIKSWNDKDGDNIMLHWSIPPVWRYNSYWVVIKVKSKMVDMVDVRLFDVWMKDSHEWQSHTGLICRGSEKDTSELKRSCLIVLGWSINLYGRETAMNVNNWDLQ